MLTHWLLVLVGKMAVTQKMEVKFYVNGLKKKRKNRLRKGKRSKGNKRSMGLVKFRGTAGPYKVGEIGKIWHIKRERRDRED